MSAYSCSNAAKRNRQPILEQLRKLLPQQGTVLEIGSGTGQHAVFFTQKLPGLRWQPSDREANLAGLEAFLLAKGNDRILPVLKLDVIHDPWPGQKLQWSCKDHHIFGRCASVRILQKQSRQGEPKSNNPKP